MWRGSEGNNTELNYNTREGYVSHPCLHVGLQKRKHPKKKNILIPILIKKGIRLGKVLSRQFSKTL